MPCDGQLRPDGHTRLSVPQCPAWPLRVLLLAQGKAVGKPSGQGQNHPDAALPRLLEQRLGIPLIAHRLDDPLGAGSHCSM